MKNKFLLSLISALTIFLAQSALAEDPILQSTTTPPKIQTVQTAPRVTSEVKPVVVSTSFENCVKTYKTSVDNLFYLTLAAINANNYKIDEIQSRTGYISFLVGNKSLLASITAVDSKISSIKITPVDNSYAFSPIVVERIFNYLSINAK